MTGTHVVPSQVADPVERFDRNLSACGYAQADRDSYLAGGINETQLRQELCLPVPLRVTHHFSTCQS